MSTTNFPDPERIHKKPVHQRNDSGELDVFEAARYFSGYNEANNIGYTTYSQKVLREERSFRGGRISLDLPMRKNNTNSLLVQQSCTVETQIKEKKLHKQPSSPGGRLASFLNSLFSQSASKKKKKSKSSKQSSVKDIEEEKGSPIGMRKRRSSISHFQSSNNTTIDKKSIYYSSSSSGFRTPPPYVQTPTKSLKEFKTIIDQRKTEPLFDNQKFSNGLLEKQRNFKNGYSEKGLRKLNEVDDGEESDSSSDLFELQICDLGYYSSDLPVYETTNVDSIKRGVPISNGPR